MEKKFDIFELFLSFTGIVNLAIDPKMTPRAVLFWVFFYAPITHIHRSTFWAICPDVVFSGLEATFFGLSRPKS